MDKKLKEILLVVDNPEREQWFKDRIGKTIYRNKTSCPCKICQAVYENGLFVNDEMQAYYCHDAELSYTREGHPMIYFDTKEEVAEFERLLEEEKELNCNK